MKSLRNLIHHKTDRILSLLITADPEPILSVKVTDRLIRAEALYVAWPKRCLYRLPMFSAKGALFLDNLFSSCLRLTYFPVKWKKITVIMIPMPDKDSSRTEKLWSIGFFPPRRKVRVWGHFERLYLLIAEQFGFRESHSSTLSVSGTKASFTFLRRPFSLIATFARPQRSFRIWTNNTLSSGRCITAGVHQRAKSEVVMAPMRRKLSGLQRQWKLNA